MWATYWEALHEVGGRKVIHGLIALGIGMGLLLNLRVVFSDVHDVPVIYYGPLNMGPWPFAVPVLLAQLTGIIGGLWTLLMVIVGCPMLAAALERGWREITFSKGTPRWHILLGRYLATGTLFFIPALLSYTPMAVRLWWHTGIPTWQVAIGALIQTFSFGALLSVGALMSISGEGGVKGMAGPLLGTIGMAFMALLLRNRDLLHNYFTSEIVRSLFDWLYYILPKVPELGDVAAGFVQSSAISSSWPLWTTGLFTLATLSLAAWLLERKSF